jgi:hypothetical protein
MDGNTRSNVPLWSAVVLATALLASAIVFGLSFRYQLHTVAGQAAWRLDRLTGETTFLAPP